MTHFLELDLPKLENVYSKLNTFMLRNSIKWFNNQICLNTIESDPTNYTLGVGSLHKDWGNRKEYGGNIEVDMKHDRLKESDFTVLCSQFKGSILEEMYDILSSRYNLGRVRIMRSEPKTCLSWHMDVNKRIHYPLKTQDGCFMVIENEVKFLPENTWWLTNTLEYHTAFNASMNPRVHLVAEVL